MQFGAAAIGIGGLGQLELEILAGLDGVDVVAGVDVSADARSVFESEFDAPAYAETGEMLAAHGDEVDVALIVTPHTLHYDQARACLAADVHVYLEKPMVTDVADAVDLIERADRNDLVIQIGYQRHFHPGFTEIKRIVDSGRIGEIHAVNAAIGQNWIDLHEGTWRVDTSLSGGGQLYDTGSHLLDAILWLTDAEPTHVSATIEYASPGVDVNSSLSVELDRDGQRVLGGVTISGKGVELAPFEGYTIWGTNGRVTFDGERIRLAERDAAVYESVIEAQTDFASLTTSKLQNFLDSIEGTAEPEVPATVGLSVTALTEAAYEAADTGRRVDVQELIDDAT
ncbi:Gfo/Idh/MocA family protein [Halosolutus amylolyticus]|uniref:Gfo/Idh/MocA family protein n=1 Tax=Halosolutus amylolyticus TaxID=2932267 RepID=A0ABD5PVW2_9EURY|nr:Gfo/Idh/MocA family oxidoreductase [Halosolutus amylolyticus]